ncbi:MAG: PhnA domain-containing protein [Pikeienuella sp.]
MSVESELRERSSGKCELCEGRGPFAGLELASGAPSGLTDVERSIVTCRTCYQQITEQEATDPHHWRKLVETMWTPVPAVQVAAWRMLDRLRAEGWARDALDQLYLDEQTQDWAEAGLEIKAGAEQEPTHFDQNGAPLATGDTVTLTKDLNVKGTSFVAKRGTHVRGISLVEDNGKQIEGRVNGQQIVILTEFVKLSG